MVGPNVFSWSEPVRAGTHQNEVNLEYAKRCKRVHTDPDEVPEMHDRPWEIEARSRGRVSVPLSPLRSVRAKAHAPVRRLDARRQRSADTSSCANTDPALVEGGGVGHAGELVCGHGSVSTT